MLMSPSEWQFVEDLKKEKQHEFRWKNRKIRKNELDIAAGFSLADVPEFPRLTTAIRSLKRFLNAAPLPKNGKIPIRFQQHSTGCEEAYSIEIKECGITLSAGEQEGFRRAIYRLEELLAASDAPCLPVGILREKSWIKNRISRCYFGPIKRPPNHRDELADAYDYYPEAYLERLASEGINGLWLTIEWKDLAVTSFSHPAPDREKRLNKLKDTVNRCLEYGIKTFLFFIEPAAFSPNSELLANHPEFGGAEAYNFISFCIGTETGRQYVRESMESITREIPELGGMINIAHGERVTSCLSSVSCMADHPVACSGKCGLRNWEIYAEIAKSMRDGMKKYAPRAELITWLYMPQGEKRGEWVFELAKHIPDGVILQYNFESNLEIPQLGKMRRGGDYWLSQIGPSKDFNRIAENASSCGSGLSAKLQVASSHEVATVPFVPVPGILYRKYQEMKQRNVSHVMQCWYFGNYPGLMNHAAGILALEPFAETEKKFLLRLAKPVWGCASEKVIRAWNCFKNAYSNYPMSNMFQYYGPMHAGVVWDWSLKFCAGALAPTWRKDFPPSGDAIGECLREHTLSEAVRLSRRMAEQWRKGLSMLKEAAAMLPEHPERRSMLTVAEALAIQFASGARILLFYKLRRNFPAAENGIRELVELEIRDRKRLAELCEEDSRLGFHSEAEVYLYDSRRIHESIERMRRWADEMKNDGADPGGAEAVSYRIDSGWHVNRMFRWRIDSLRHRKIRLCLEVAPTPERKVFEFAVTDEWISEAVRFLSWDDSGVIRNHFEECESRWIDSGHFEAVIRLPHRKNRFSISCAVGPHDRETMLDAWPERPGHRKPQLRLELRYFLPNYTGILHENQRYFPGPIRLRSIQRFR